jgi:pimeloyl-ACP methyl ester carboxylesterase
MTQVIHGPSESQRALAFEEWGAPGGYPVFLLHGTPGSRHGPRPRASVLYRLDIRLISYDRPGYGESAQHRGRSVADAALDVVAIADQLGLDDFSVVGRSGGGPHALACAASDKLQARLRSAAVLVPLAPADADGLDWYDGMNDSNTEGYTGISDQAAANTVVEILNERAGHIQKDPEYLLQFLQHELTEPDRRVVEDLGIRRLLTDTYREALRSGADGWIDDMLAFRKPWGFQLSAIQIPTLLWHGQDDVFSPASHTRWLAGQIPAKYCTVEMQPGAAHFDAVGVLPRILTWLKSAALKSAAASAPRRPGSERLRVQRTDQAPARAQYADRRVPSADSR